MMVTFVSQCEKKALNKTRRVLDAFANRIGDNTWQTVITNEGLNAVRKLLRKTASKNTAVTCHWLRSRSRSELIWIVGNRQQFNDQGIVPVNSTKKNIMNTQWENDWHYLPIIKSLTALAALFHDWGKASDCFQEKLQPKKSKKIISDPLRHEWVSILLLNAFINGETDEQWLIRLANGDINEDLLKKSVIKNISKPLAKLPPVASLLAWLIVSHHKLPLLDNKQDQITCKGEQIEDVKDLFELIKSDFGYKNTKDKKEYHAKLKDCLTFSNGFPVESEPWLRQAKKWAEKMKQHLTLFEQAMTDGSWRLILHHARLSLMMGDYFYSSQEADKDKKWQNSPSMFANTDKKTGKLKQKLDEHLVGVAKHALKTAHLLPLFETEPEKIHDIKALKKSSPLGYRWQDKAVNKIKDWKKVLPEIQ